MNKILAVAATLILFFGSSIAAAQCTPETAGRMGPGPGMPDFSEFDLDADGSIVSAEFYEARAKRMAERARAGGKMKHAGTMPTFEDIDTNSDGKISAEEFTAHQAEEMGKGCGKGC